MKNKIVFIALLFALAFSAVGVYGQTVQDYASQAVNYYIEKDYDRAITAASQVIRLAPNIFNGYFLRGASYIQKGNYDNAIADLTNAIALEPNNADNYSERARAYFLKGYWRHAEADADIALRLNPKKESAQNVKNTITVDKGFLDTSKSKYYSSPEITAANTPKPTITPARNTPSPSPTPAQPAVPDFEMNGTTLVKYNGKATNVTIPSNVKVIGEYAFSESGVSNLTIPSGVTTIEGGAFFMSDLSSISIPASVTSIDIDRVPFNHCTRLTSITVDAQNRNYTSVDGVLFSKDKKTLIQYPAGKNSSSYTIPVGVITIWGQAFCYSGRLTSVTIPSSVTTIGYWSFARSGLTSVTIPSSVTTIEDYAFGECNSLTSVTLSRKTTIGEDAFPSGAKLTYSDPAPATSDFEMSGTTLVKYNGNAVNVTIPSNVTVIGDKALRNKYLTGVTIPNGVTVIGNDSFRWNKLTSVTIPNSVTSIGEGAFWDNKLTSVTIPDNVNFIGESAFQENQLTSVNFGSRLATIGEYAFWKNRITSVTIPNSVTDIGHDAFKENQITSVTFGNRVTTIGNYAFNKNKLTSVTIPNSVTTIENGAFRENQITTVTIGNGVTTIGIGAFAENQITSVTIGANVTLGAGAIGNGFESFYNSNGKKAGTYTYDGKNWNAKSAPAPAVAPAVAPDKAAYDRGRAAYDQKDYDRAITEFTEAIRLNSNYELAYYFRAEAYIMKDDYDRALADFNQTVRLSPNDVDNYSERGYVYILKSDYDRAIADFNQALKLDPDNSDAKEGLELARRRQQGSSSQPAAPSVNANHNFIPPSAWKPDDIKNDSPGTTKRFFNTREVIEGQERDVLTMEVTFTRQTQAGGPSKWGSFQIKDNEPILSQLRTASGVRFKAIGDGKKWFLILDTKETMSDHCSYRSEIKTRNNQVVYIDIPYSSLRQPDWGRKTRFVKNNIMVIVLQRLTDTASETGTSTLKVFDFEVY